MQMNFEVGTCFQKGIHTEALHKRTITRNYSFLNCNQNLFSEIPCLNVNIRK